MGVYVRFGGVLVGVWWTGGCECGILWVCVMGSVMGAESAKNA